MKIAFNPHIQDKLTRISSVQIWKLFSRLENILRSGDCLKLKYISLKCKRKAWKPSVTESVATDVTHTENSKSQLFTQ